MSRRLRSVLLVTRYVLYCKNVCTATPHTHANPLGTFPWFLSSICGLSHPAKGLSLVLRTCLVTHDDQHATLIVMCRLLRHAPEHGSVVMDIIGLSEGMVALVL